ncbi:hypothetical protein CLAFUW4_07582 [Fulvia fulva]|uniref:Uncharacterized protein n=1 Tax=Passalora fulva TaxID=5499 RepID=A0A9Q8PAQ0_PASFU|nr:uncharacterized protein CLAFUR5_07712 [Fulvia fulva]KAK4621214.1 hypothetical protein CLAFUR4_07588 [Fulvia fulva]KAK4622862.1 hypothetical protein CLAFUR0_07587 [Fulvia fulva]UJO19023.1 hypothetical protein CLAFUR5_07712 [Fulvia fulva]WPV16467.1 hypothetical protein CLAFUW4_07582 [Fulvia fulva]WPV31372.1 hypothetical protein CLAFUW7_07584 [Fulvia fulva]
MLGIRLVALVASIATVANAAPAAQGDDPACTKCEDFANDCGRWYGGCYNTCTGPVPIYAVPECPCDDNPSDGIQRPDDCPKPKPGEKCEWYYNECGARYGGCYPEAGPIPGWAAPECVKTDDGGLPPAPAQQ